MAYVSQDLKKQIALALKPVFKKYGVFATLNVEHYSVLNVNISKGPVDFKTTYKQIYGHWLADSFDGVAYVFLKEVFDVIKSAGGWFDKSDSSIDYFETAFYITVNIGRWEKPYVLTSK